MKNIITRVDALQFAVNTIANLDAFDNQSEIVNVLQRMSEQISKPRRTSEEAKERANKARKEKTIKAREELCANVIPILRDVITTDMTAKEIFTAAEDRLPNDFSAQKVQNILLREMASELIKTEKKGKANTYRLA